jgi:hypothetical protein
MWQTVETVLSWWRFHTQLKQGVNEKGAAKVGSV